MNEYLVFSTKPRLSQRVLRWIQEIKAIAVISMLIELILCDGIDEVLLMKWRWKD